MNEMPMIRIVKMKFKPENVAAFVQLFEERKHMIRVIGTIQNIWRNIEPANSLQILGQRPKPFLLLLQLPGVCASR
jgi:hypothetical protein